jgi:copper chaperone CopZ
VAVNLLLFMVVFPLAANLKQPSGLTASAMEEINNQGQKENITLEVQIPCSGHAPLITEELNKINGIKSIQFRLPNLFDITYDSGKTSKEKILSLEIFNTYKATIK